MALVTEKAPRFGDDLDSLLSLQLLRDRVLLCRSNPLLGRITCLLCGVTGLLPRSSRREKEREKSPGFASGACTPAESGTTIFVSVRCMLPMHPRSRDKPLLRLDCPASGYRMIHACHGTG